LSYLLDFAVDSATLSKVWTVYLLKADMDYYNMKNVGLQPPGLVVKTKVDRYRLIGSRLCL